LERPNAVATIFDSRWHKQALAGEESAVAALADAMLEPLFRFCLYRVGRDRHLCEDVVQETLVKAIGQLESYDPQRSAGDIFPWLTGLARNEIRRALAQSPSAASLEALWRRMDKELLSLYGQLESEPFAADLLAREETREMVNAAMSQLSPQYSAALESKYILGRSVREIAKAWHVSEKGVESQLSRARQAFRTVFLALSQNLGAE
jgi:RNA polymerase sigma-70 factor (ECF subfamily)